MFLLLSNRLTCAYTPQGHYFLVYAPPIFYLFLVMLKTLGTFEVGVPKVLDNVTLLAIVHSKLIKLITGIFIVAEANCFSCDMAISGYYFIYFCLSLFWEMCICKLRHERCLKFSYVYKPFYNISHTVHAFFIKGRNASVNYFCLGAICKWCK